MEIMLLRHGESEGNAQGRMQGRRDFPLSALGRQQAARADPNRQRSHHQADFEIAYLQHLSSV